MVACFRRYMDHGGTPVSRAEFEANLAEKASNPAFHEDVKRLLSASVRYDPQNALEVVLREIVARLPGDPWKGREASGHRP